MPLFLSNEYLTCNGDIAKRPPRQTFSHDNAKRGYVKRKLIAEIVGGHGTIWDSMNVGKIVRKTGYFTGWRGNAAKYRAFSFLALVQTSEIQTFLFYINTHALQFIP